MDADLLDAMNYAPQFLIKPQSSTQIVNFKNPDSVATKYQLQLSQIMEDTQMKSMTLTSAFGDLIFRFN